MQINLSDMMRSRERATNRNALAQENAANAAAQGQIGASRMASEGNVLANIYSQPANFGSIFGDMYGNYGANTGAQGGNYTNAYGAYTAGLGGLGNSSAQNFANYSAGLQNAANNYGQMYNANSQAEAARQMAAGNMGSAALGAYGSAANSAFGAYGLQQQAYNMAIANAMNANQGALSSLGQSRNAALANVGNAYGAVGNAAAQLGGAGLNASQTSQTDNYQDQIARNRQATGGYSNDYASMYGGGGGEFGGGGGGSGGFMASGPEGTIASGAYGGPASGDYYGGAYDMGGNRTAQSATYGSNDSMARNTQRATQTTGPQMDAFRASLGSGMAGIGGALGGLADSRADVMDNSVLRALQSANASGMGQLRRGNEEAAGRPQAMLSDTLGGLLRLGGQGHSNLRRGMDQYYGAASGAGDAQAGILGMLASGYQGASNQLGGLAGGMSAGYGNTVGNIDNVRGDLRSGMNTARGDVQGLYDGSIGNWMSGNRDPNNYFLPRYQQPTREERQQELYNQGFDWNPEAGRWETQGGRMRQSTYFPGPR